MCTVTVIPCVPSDHGLRSAVPRCRVRLACNRDEQRSRPAALRPRVARFGKRRAILPIDLASGGTWVAVNDAALAVTLLNVNPDPIHEGWGRHFCLPRQTGVSAPPRSRGTIIPALLSSDSVQDALRQAEKPAAADYAPFRLVLVDLHEFAELYSDGERLRQIRRGRLLWPVLFTSSGLGDRLVEGPRRRLFEEHFGERRGWLDRQDAFHRHRWPQQPHLSVCMDRPDARTVSYTVIALDDAAVTLTYYPEAPDRAVQPVVAALDVQRVGTP